jgi:hypothetical protein
VPLTTLSWNGTGAHLNHEYQFDFDLPQARTAFGRRSPSSPRRPGADHLPDPAAPPRKRRWRRIAWQAGWLLLALVSLGVTYSLLVAGGR